MAKQVYQGRITPEERRRLAAKLTSATPDNGKVHYGSGMRGALCGVDDPNRIERSENRGITCPNCIKSLRMRP